MNISVAMATFNGGPYLQEQLDSIRSQSLPPTELVICDDGSVDNTLDIARRFAREASFKVTIDAHGRRLGYSDNFIRAVNTCTGEVIALCDQDDVWMDHKLEAACDQFRDASVVAVAHRIRVVNERLVPSGLVLPTKLTPGRFTLQNLDPWFAPGGMHLLFRRSGIAPWVDEVRTLSKWCHGDAPFDEWIFYLATLAGTVVLMEDVLGLWRRHSTSTTGSPEATANVYSAAFQRQLALTVGSTQYAYQAEVADSRADFAARVHSSSDTVSEAINFYRRMAHTYRRRSCLHHPSAGRLRRLLILAGMVTRNDHRGRNRGGLGAKSLVKDLYAVLRGPARSASKTNLENKDG